jgi:hypothetical protein
LLAGAVQLILTFVPSLTVVTELIYAGASAGIIVTSFEYGPHPMMFLALSLNLYDEPAVRPVFVSVSEVSALDSPYKSVQVLITLP